MKFRSPSRDCSARSARSFSPSSAQAAAFHSQFVSLVNGGAAAYVEAEIANAQQTLVSLGTGVPSRRPPSLAAPTCSSSTSAATNLQGLYNSFAASPFPLLNQFLANQLRYLGTIPGTIANLPAFVAGLPTNIQAFPEL